MELKVKTTLPSPNIVLQRPRILGSAKKNQRVGGVRWGLVLAPWPLPWIHKVDISYRDSYKPEASWIDTVHTYCTTIQLGL